ncbi:hypothetical protein M2351_006983 [Azospirillum canadense]|nr:hypothetical protein [Azospirillum canadense]
MDVLMSATCHAGPPTANLTTPLLWIHTFDTVEDLRRALVEFARHDNETWLVARHGHRTPAQVRADQLGVDETPMAELPLAA